MKASVTAEDDQYIGLDVTDNQEIVHDLTLKKEGGEIAYHGQDGYPDDPSKRTPEGNEHVEQARRFAQYYVSVDRGYDTVPPMIHPGRLDAVRQVIEAMPTVACRNYFGDLHQQMASHHGGDDRVLDIPADVSSPRFILYRKDIYLGVDPAEIGDVDAVESLAAKYGLDLDSLPVSERSVDDLSPSERDAWLEFGDELDQSTDSDVDHFETMSLDAVSDLSMAYPDQHGREHVMDVDQPLDREPDARFELSPIDPRSPKEFQTYLAFNLRCQIRDCFVRMGVQPPEPFRVLGYGRYEAAERYNKVAFYPAYHDPQYLDKVH